MGEAITTPAGPESCAHSREGSVERGTCGPGIQPPTFFPRAPTPPQGEAEGHTGRGASAKRDGPRAVSDPAHARKSRCTGAGRIPELPAAEGAVGRIGKPAGVRR